MDALTWEPTMALPHSVPSLHKPQITKQKNNTSLKCSIEETSKLEDQLLFHHPKSYTPANRPHPAIPTENHLPYKRAETSCMSGYLWLHLVTRQCSPSFSTRAVNCWMKLALNIKWPEPNATNSPLRWTGSDSDGFGKATVRPILGFQGSNNLQIPRTPVHPWKIHGHRLIQLLGHEDWKMNFPFEFCLGWGHEGFSSGF